MSNVTETAEERAFVGDYFQMWINTHLENLQLQDVEFGIDKQRQRVNCKKGTFLFTALNTPKNVAAISSSYDGDMSAAYRTNTLCNISVPHHLQVWC